MFAHPVFDDAGDDLHRTGDVDFSGGVAGRGDRFGHLKAEAVAGQAYHTRTMDRTVEMARQPRQHRISLAAPPEKSHVHATLEMLVDQHPDMRAALQLRRDLEHGVRRRRE